MCEWRHYFYGACRHQETVPHKYCARAMAVTGDDAAPEKEEHGDPLATSSGPDRREEGGNGDDTAPQERPRPDVSRSSSPSRLPPTSSTQTSSKHRTTTASSFSPSIQSSVTPIPEETEEDIASLAGPQQRHIYPRRHSEPAAPDMAGLAPFGKATFRQLMGGGGSPQLATPVTTTKNHNDHEELKPELNKQGGSFRVRQPGIRDRSDESYDLPNSNDILQHISSCCRGDSRSSRIGIDARRESSYGSDIHDFAVHGAPPTQDSFDAIESDLNVLKTEIAALRKEESSRAPTTDISQSAEHFPALPSSVRAKIPTRISIPQEPPLSTPASRTQAKWEREQKELQERLAREKWERENISPERPPGLEEFPGLGNAAPAPVSQKNVNTAWGGQGMRKLSYASAASSGMKDAVDKSVSGKRSSIGSDVVSTASGSRTSRGSIGSLNSPQQTVASPEIQTTIEGADSSVIISSPKVHAGISPVQTKKAATSSSTVGKHSPRFAQPTKATARRADETLRKDSATIIKSSPEASPNKSFRTASRRTSKRQPLPGAWVSSPDSSPTKPSLAAAAGSVKSSSPFRSQAPELSPSQEKKALSPTPAKPSPEHALRKKTSSYMSPTKATTRRTVETLGQESVKQTSPRLSRSSSKIDTAVSPTKAFTSPLEKTPPLSVPLSGSTLASASSPFDFQPHNITEAVLQHLMTGKPPEKQEASSTKTDGLAIQAPSSASVSIFSSLEQPPSQMGRCRTLGSSHASEMATDMSPEAVAARFKEGGLPEVANTTVKRRGSHGHLLTPIIKRLGKEGLLKSPPTVPEERPESAVEVGPLAADATIIQQDASMLPPGRKQESNMPAPHALPPHIMRDIAFQAALQNASGSVAHQAAKVGSLRATAEEFKPMWQPQTMQQHAGQLAWQGNLDYRTPEEWQALPHSVREAITTLRHYNKNDGTTLRHYNKNDGSQSPGRRPHNTFPSAYSPPKKSRPCVPDVGSWNQSIQDQIPAPVLPSQDHAPPQLPERQPFFTFKPVPEPYVPDPGAIIRPELDPHTGVIEWYRIGSDGKKEVACFGRAPAPDIHPEDVVISPSSISTSSPANPNTPTPDRPRRWRIQSLMSDKYGWTGGNGLEISFRGSGANAERDPNPPSDVQFSSKENACRSASLGNGARFIGGDKNDGSNSPPLAPRSRAQWAKLQGYKMVPCNEINVDAFEMIPRPDILPGEPSPPGWGYCQPCLPDV